jgi:hypothetical protein
MPNYTIVRDSNTVFVDQEPRGVDCSALPNYFHALQWYGDAEPEPYGEIEYMADATGKRMPNTRFSDFAPYQSYVDAWYAVEPPDDVNPALEDDEPEDDEPEEDEEPEAEPKKAKPAKKAKASAKTTRRKR